MIPFFKSNCSYVHKQFYSRCNFSHIERAHILNQTGVIIFNNGITMSTLNVTFSRE
jgi:hypothetical protein